MRDGRPNPDIWGNIITCGEIAVGIYEIVGTKKRGLEVPKALAEEILPESVMEQAAHKLPPFHSGKQDFDNNSLIA